jgi:hypothetical protein
MMDKKLFIQFYLYSDDSTFQFKLQVGTFFELLLNHSICNRAYVRIPRILLLLLLLLFNIAINISIKTYRIQEDTRCPITT